MCKNVIIIGASGHAKVIADIVLKSGDNLVGFLDDDVTKKSVLGYPVLGKISECLNYIDTYFIIGIGNNHIRKSIAEKYGNLKYYTAIHPTATIACDVKVGDGTCIMAQSVINASTQIGKHCIINTSAVVEHDNDIKDYVHISPGAVLCGTVIIGEETHVGAGVTVKNNITITGNCIIGAGATVVKDITESSTYIGIPAEIMRGGVAFKLLFAHTFERRCVA